MKEKRDFCVDLGERLKMARKCLGITQEEVAGVLDLSVGHYRKIEYGTYMAKTYHLYVLCENYGIDPGYLLYGNKRSPNDLYLLGNRKGSKGNRK